MSNPQQLIGPELLEEIIDHLKQDDDEGCCGIPGCEHSLIGHIILVDGETVSRGACNQRIEAFVLDQRENSIKLRFKDDDEGWFDPDCLEDDLGEATPDQYQQFGVNIPEPPPTPDYQTGTYVANGPNGPNGPNSLLLVEIDRVGDTYLIHEAGGNNVEPLTPEVWEILDTFSDPDNGDYVTEPGPYYVEKLGCLIEVVPYGGYSYYRFINDAQLTRLHAPLVKDTARVETDTFEVNAIMVMPPEPQNLEDGNGREMPTLNNNENVPTGCCQAAPQE